MMFYINSGLIAGAKLLGIYLRDGAQPERLLTLVAVASYTFIGGFMGRLPNGRISVSCDAGQLHHTTAYADLCHR